MATDNIARGLAAHALSVAQAGGGEHPVESVNGKTGKVNLNAADVGALSLSGGALNGDLDLNDHEIINAYIIRANAQPTEDDELTRKDYVDNAIASASGAKFIINLTEDNATQTYIADKDWADIRAAYESGKVLAVHIGSSELPLMNGQIADNGAGFTFGYTNIIAGGTAVYTRAIHYLHTEDSDEWKDADAEGEYISVNGGTMAGSLILNGEPVDDNEAANKNYVDSRRFKVTFQRDPVAGLNADFSFDAILEAATAGKTVVAVFDNNEYHLSYATDTEMIFSGITGSIATEIIYAAGAWTQSTVPLMPTSGGTFTGNVDMGGNSITNAQKIHVDGAAPLYIGSTIEPAGTSGTRLTGTTSGAAAFVKAATQTEYVPVYVGTPTENSHSANKKYVDDTVGAADIAHYVADEQLVVNEVPDADDHAASKKYVDSCSQDYIVNIENGTADKTFGEISVAIANKKNVNVSLLDNGLTIQLPYVCTIENKLTFTSNIDSRIVVVAISADGTVEQTGLECLSYSDGQETVEAYNKRLINVATPTSEKDAANKAYVDGRITGLFNYDSSTKTLTITTATGIDSLIWNGGTA